MALRQFIPLLFASLVLFQSIALAGAVNERQATQSAKSKYQATVLAVKSINAAGQQYFKIKLLLDNGRIKTVYVNSDNGKISDRKP